MRSPSRSTETCGSLLAVGGELGTAAATGWKGAASWACGTMVRRKFEAPGADLDRVLAKGVKASLMVALARVSLLRMGH